MNDLTIIGLEVAVIATGLGLLMLDLWTPREQKARLGYAAAAALLCILVASFAITSGEPKLAFGGMYVLDAMGLFFKRFFLLAAILVLLMSVEFAERFETGIAEYYSLTLFALAGMMFAASANDFSLLFVSVELITVTFYILTSFQRGRAASLESGIKYLILGAVSSAFLVYGIALVFGASGTMNFQQLSESAPPVLTSRLLALGLLLVFVGLGFKVAAVPFQVWAPDVYQGAPTPTTAFLAVGSKAAGIVLLLRVLHAAAPAITGHWVKLLICVSALSILYGNLCVIPQQNLKRLLAYSSIANAGYLFIGIAASSVAGSTAVLYYLAGYLFTVLAAFTVICLAMRSIEGESISALSGLHQRSPLLGATLALSMVSLAGIPPLAGFFGKFLLLKSALAQAGTQHGFYCLVGVAIVGVVVSLYYYFGVIRAIYWPSPGADLSPIQLSRPIQVALCVCVVGMLGLGLFPNTLLDLAAQAAANLSGSAT